MKYDLISETIIKMTADRSPDKTVCPSEIARELFSADWRKHMNEVRESAIKLHQKGVVIITQKGIPVDLGHITGPIRIKYNTSFRK